MHVDNIFLGEETGVVGQGLVAEFDHEADVVNGVRHGGGVCHGNFPPMELLGAIVGHQGGQPDAVTEVAQVLDAGEMRQLLVTLKNKMGYINNKRAN